MARRGVVGAVVACGALGVLAPAAFANHITAVNVNSSCTAVTFSYTDFNAGSVSSPTEITESLFLNGSSTPADTTTYGETGPPTYAGTFTTPAVPLTGAVSGDTLVAEAYWSGNNNTAHPASDPDVWSTITLSCPAPPTVTIITPPSGNPTYPTGGVPPANYSCSPGAGETLESPGGCVGTIVGGSPVLNGGPLPNTPGTYCLQVTATDTDGQTATQTNCYNVVNLTYTGDAYNVGAGVTIDTPLLAPVTASLAPIENTGEMDTTSTTFSNPVSLLNAGLPGVVEVTTLDDNTTTSVGTAMATSSTTLTSLLGQTVTAGTATGNVITTTSATTCTDGTLGYVGTNNLTSLTIGTTKVVGAPGSGAIVTTPITPNETVPVPGVGTIILDQQTPLYVGTTQVGLTVNAINIEVNVISVLGVKTTGSVIVGHSESDVEGCSSITA